MKVLFINTHYMHGGAGRAAGRLQIALKNIGVDVKQLVQNGFGDRHDSIIGPLSPFEKLLALWKPALEMLPLYLYNKRNGLPFSTSFQSDIILSKVNELNPDIIHLHWTCSGFVKIETLKKLNKPIVWTLHDSWAFTGGCHIPLDCDRYIGKCGNCATLGSRFDYDLSRWIWNRKFNSWRGLDITLVTPSNWLAACVRSSSLFRGKRVEVIPNGLDFGTMSCIDKHIARKMFSLDLEKKYILFGAVNATSDKNKGFQHVVSALRAVLKELAALDCELLVFGGYEPAEFSGFGLKTHYIGYLHDEVSINLLYSAADVFIAPSLQENLPNTIMEAMACGLPVVAFSVGGIPDIVNHKLNGYLAQPYNTDDLAHGLLSILSNLPFCEQLSRTAQDTIKDRFNINDVAGKHLDLYSTLVKDSLC
ncbi:MAG: glycosyltransferase family 4 protein [Desulfuromonadaceae bacterium]|nr:glycosyltransferase family 4 protein [Desulfuromonadaceae bacterium]MDD5106400.1 glycosyltransferase family 4 protein [Desulfuromonadaceae bacterium]